MTSILSQIKPKEGVTVYAISFKSDLNALKPRKVIVLEMSVPKVSEIFI